MKNLSIITTIAGFLANGLMAFLLSPYYAISSGFFLILLVLVIIENKKSPKAQENVQKSDSSTTMERSDLQEHITTITDFLKNMVKHNEIDLTRRIAIDDSLFVSVEDYLNFLITSLSETITWIIDRSEKLSIFSAQTNYYTMASQSKSEEQTKYAHEIIELVHELLESFQDIVSKSQNAFNISDEANLTYQKGSEVMDYTENSVKKLDEFINYTTQYMEDLQKFTSEMEKVLKVIIDMAQRTNMLSLNASIEAVRAGEAGKGFKIVAQEIQKFSQKTTEASKSITSTLKQLNQKMKNSFDMVNKNKDTIHSVMENTASLKESFLTLSNFITQSLNSTRDISSIASGELTKIENIDQKITNIQTTISEFNDEFGFLGESAANITNSAEDIARMINNFQMDNYQTNARKIMGAYVDEVVKVFQSKVESGKLSPNQFYDKDYIQVVGTNPEQYHTVYDEMIETEVQELLESLKEELTVLAANYSKQFLACAITNEDGYAPTHLKAVAQKPTGDYEHDLAFCRDKRFFTDPVSTKAAKNKSEFLLQVYMRDDGNQNIDLSVPIKFNDKHWGCLRAGYTVK